MCVILACDVSRPTEEMVSNSYNVNNDGGGIAWHGVSEDGSPTIKWRKGLTLQEMLRLRTSTPLPYIMHFRIASIGGVTDHLTHPFPLDDQVPTWLEGECANGVLFHNGHWTWWDQWLRDLVFKSGLGVRLPAGHWSDSRAMAFIAQHMGWGVLDWQEFAAQRIAILAPPTEENPEGIYLFGRWPAKIGGPREKGGGVLASNESWKSKGFRSACDPTYTQPPASMAGRGASGREVLPGSVVECGSVTKPAAESAKILLGPGGDPTPLPPGQPPVSGSNGSGTIIGGVMAKVLHRLRRGEERKRARENRRVDQMIQAEVSVLCAKVH